MTTHNPIAGSHRQIKMPYRWQVITLPTSVLHRHSDWPDWRSLYNPEVSLLKICIPAPHNCCAFCQTLIAPNLTSIRCFRILSLTLPIIYCIDKKKAGCSRRVRIVAPHIPHVLYAFTYSIVKVRQAESLLPSESFHDLISHKSTQGKTVVKLLVCFLWMMKSVYIVSKILWNMITISIIFCFFRSRGSCLT